ncbi:MAG: MBL fold metallo-hydrolase [Ilumatobacteraceae bacterium]
MAAPRFETLDEVEYGRVDQVADGIRRVIAENPSKFTYRGTGTYIIGNGDVLVVDPGPVLDSHREALSVALAGERVRGILITHCHSDHSPLAAWMRTETGAPTFAFGPHGAVDDEDDGDDSDGSDGDGSDGDGSDGDGSDGDAEEIDDGVKIEETIDVDFVPDVALADGEQIAVGPGLTVTAVHTPGHTSNHMCYALAEPSVLFTGDHVMGWSTTVVSPPDGDMADYIESLRKVAGRRDAMLVPTHGPPRRDGPEFVAALVEHRLDRERQVIDAVRRGVDAIPAMVAELYADVPVELHKPAGRSVLAHLVKLVRDGDAAVADGGRPRLRSRYLPA